jgi:hypothetical protein
MSLNDLPDELLAKIAACTCAAHHYEEEFKYFGNQFEAIRHTNLLAWCYNCGVE